MECCPVSLVFNSVVEQLRERSENPELFAVLKKLQEQGHNTLHLYLYAMRFLASIMDCASTAYELCHRPYPARTHNW